MNKTFSFILFVTSSAFAQADPAVIEAVKGIRSDSTWRFDVTLSHADTGWDHYADGWRVLGLDGTVLGTRILHHPHVDEQPFTRSLSGVEIPGDIQKVQIEAKDSEDGWSGDRVILDLNNPTYAR